MKLYPGDTESCLDFEGILESVGFSGKGRIWNSSQLFRALGSLLQNVDKQLSTNGIPGAVGEVPRRLCAQDVGQTGVPRLKQDVRQKDITLLTLVQCKFSEW